MLTYPGRIGRVAVLAAGVLGLIATLSLPAVAAGPTLSLAPKSGPPTTTVRVAVTGFEPAEVVGVAFDASTVVSATADSSGAVETSFMVPASALPGAHPVTATGGTSGLSAGAKFMVRTNWTQFHRDQVENGYNPHENVLSATNVGSLSVKWSYSMFTGTGFNLIASTPALVTKGWLNQETWAVWLTR